MAAEPHVYQLGLGPWGPFACMAAAASMEAAAHGYSAGALTIRANQNDQSGGIGLDDVALAFRRLGIPGWQYGARSWSTVRARLASGQGAVVEVTYRRMGAYRAPGSRFEGPHALRLHGLAPGGGVRVGDPLRTGPATIPEAAVRAAYRGRAGWLTGSSAGAGASGGNVTLWGVWTVREGHVLTAGDVDTIMGRLRAAGWFAGDTPTAPPPFGDARGEGAAARATRAVLTRHVGEPVTHALARTLQAELRGEAGAAIPSIPVVGDVLAGVEAAVGHGVLLAAIAGMVLLGLYLTFREPSTVQVITRRIARG